MGGRVGTTDAHLERLGDKLCLVDADGARWRAYDVGFGPPHAKPFKHRVYAPGSARATDCRFIAQDGTQHVHKFTRGESRELKRAVLAKGLTVRRATALMRREKARHRGS